MANLVIPPCFNWYEPYVVACTPDNTVIYGARNDLVIVRTTDEAYKLADVKIIPRAHYKRIVGVAVSREWGAKVASKIVATASEEGVVKLWNIEQHRKLISHREHGTSENVIGLCWGADDRVVSITTKGKIVVWNVLLNKCHAITLFGPRDTVTCISSCPHAPWLTAVGFQKGIVAICDLRREGKVLHRLRGHEKPLLSLSWCPVPINIFPLHQGNTIAQKPVMPNEELYDDIHIPQNEVPPLIEEEEEQFDLNREIQELTIQEREDSKEKAPESEEPKSLKLLTMENLRERQLARQISSSSGSQASSKKKGPRMSKSMQKKAKRDMRNEMTMRKTGFGGVGLEDPELSSSSAQSGRKKEGKISGNESGTESSSSKPIKKKIFQAKGKSPKKKDKPAVEKKTEVTQEKSVADKEEAVADKEEDEAVKKETSREETVAAVEPTPVQEVKPAAPAPKPLATAEDWRISTSSEEEPRKEYLLATSAREGRIYIWRAGTDGRMQTCLALPNKPIGKNVRRNPDKIFVVLNWAAPQMLFCSSKYGELFQFNLPKPAEPKHQYKVISRDTGPTIFSIFHHLKLWDQSNWKNAKIQNVWTAGINRNLVNTDLSGNKVVVSLPTMGGLISQMTASTLVPTRLAIGSTEGALRVWDIGVIRPKVITMKSNHSRIFANVSSIAWHPQKEFVLTYGTKEGRVGTLDTSKGGKIPELLQSYFVTEVHKVEFGPLRDYHLGVYAASEGKLAIYDPRKPNECPHIFVMPEKAFVYNFSWFPNRMKLLVSLKDKTLLEYDRDLRLLATHYVQNKFDSFVWNPHVVQNFVDSKYADTFAAVNGGNDFVVFKLQKANGEEYSLRTFKGHKMKVRGVSWCGPLSNFLCSVADDGAAHVWNADTATIAYTFLQPTYEPIVSVLTHPVIADFILVASRDYSLHMFKFVDNTARTPTEIMDGRSRFLKQVTKETMDQMGASAAEAQAKEKKDAKVNILPAFYLAKNPGSHIADLEKLLDWKEAGGVVEDVGNAEAGAGDATTNAIFRMYGTKKNMADLITHNINVNRQKGKFDACNMLAMIKGNFREAVQECIAQKRVTSWVLSLAPVHCSDLWQKACEVYCEQLCQDVDVDYLELAAYYLALHKVSEAVDALCSGNMYREALALAKLRTPEGSALTDTVIERWRHHAFTTGNFEVAAQHDIAKGQYENAAKILFRREDFGALNLSLRLASLVGNEELIAAIHVRIRAFAGQFNQGEVAPVVQGESAQDAQEEIEENIQEAIDEEFQESPEVLNVEDNHQG